MNELGWSILIGLAAFRLWRLGALDSITAPLRDPIQRALIGDPPDRWEPRPMGHQFYGWRGKVWELATCAWCSGSWLAFGMTWVADRYVSLATPVLVGLGAAAVVGFVAARS